MSEIKFKRDTAFRKQFFVPDSFAHPAKMDAQLLIWITEHYTKVGETILDPMAGSGTMMLACGLGRDCVLVELEGKFCKMMRDNWEQVKMRPQLGYDMGTCQIIQGDARNLTTLPYSTLQQSDAIITSPPFQEPDVRRKGMTKSREGYNYGSKLKMSSEHPDNISRLAETNYGEIDKIITSPPYADTGHSQGESEMQKDIIAKKRTWAGQEYSDNPQNLGNLPYGDIDAIVTSPPYEEALGSKHHSPRADKMMAEGVQGMSYTEIGNKDNIGNLKSQSYLEAMLQVYSQCFAVLKSGGLLILVTKNFIRNKQVVRLDTDTIKLCEQAGFKFLERHDRELPAQSFWRVIYHQKHPEVEQIKYEDVLVFNC